MSAPRVLLTGATGGLGRATAHALAARGARLVLAVRDVDAGRAVVPGAEVVRLDLADLDSVGALLAAVEDEFDAVVLNAGRQYVDRRHTTAQGVEAAFGVNLLANAVLAAGLRDRARRVVLVASGTHRDARLRNFGFPPPRWEPPEQLAQPGPGSGQVAYATAKLALVLWGLEAARRWPGTEVLIYDPGLLPGTGLARDRGAVQRFAWEHVLPTVLRPVPGVSTPERSGRALAGLALGDGQHPSGTYLQIDRVKQPDAAARDVQRAALVFDWAAATAA